MNDVRIKVPLSKLEIIKDLAQKILAGRANYNASTEHYLREVIIEQRNEALRLINLIDMLLKQ